MKWSRAVSALVILIPLAGISQVWQESEPGFDMFYGEKSFQEIDLGVAPISSPPGLGGEIDFKYNTMSRKSMDAAHWRNYYGAGIDIVAAAFQDYSFSEYGVRDVSASWAGVVIESKLFYSDEAAVRPYVGGLVSIGFGGVSLSEPEDDDEYDRLDAARMELYQLGAEAGVHIMLNDEYALVISDTTSYSIIIIPGDLMQAVQTTVTIGVSRWRARGQ